MLCMVDSRAETNDVRAVDANVGHSRNVMLRQQRHIHRIYPQDEIRVDAVLRSIALKYRVRTGPWGFLIMVESER
jgi:hypothetical protein